MEIRTRKVNGRDVKTYVCELLAANVLEVEVGTTGIRGGDTGHGGRTFFRLADLGGTDMRVGANNSNNPEVIIEFGGDCELDTFTRALEFALFVLNDIQKYEDHTENWAEL